MVLFLGGGVEIRISLSGSFQRSDFRHEAEKFHQWTSVSFVDTCCLW